MDKRFAKFTLLINTISRYITKIKAMEMNVFNLKSYHVSCLFYLHQNMDHGLTASELCSMCEEDKGTISRSLSYLEDRGYIISKTDDTNKKKYRTKLFLTNQGKEIGLKITELTNRAVTRASNGITDKEREDMYKALDIVSNNLREICEKYGDKYGN